jgi:GNAT superfamily N-acetyltransferase
MTTGAATFHELDVDYDEALAQRLYREVLAVSFDTDELDDFDRFSRGLVGKAEVPTLATVALGHDSQVLGGIVGEIYASSKTLLLSYLAVRPDVRTHGIGAALVNHAVPRWRHRSECRLAVAEVHDPRRWSAPADAAEARLRFFERVGAHALGVPFVQPALEPGRSRVSGFLLLVFDSDHEREVPAAHVARFVRDYYAVAEGAVPPFDPQLAELLAFIEREPRIPVYPIADYARVPTLRF